MTSIDSFLDSVKAVLIAPTTGVAELEDTNTTVFHHGTSDAAEDIAKGIAKCAGVHCLIFDMGGDSDPADANSPVILAEVTVELYVDPTKRNRAKTPTLRLAGAIRDAIMTCLHLNATLQATDHYHMETRVMGYRPLSDPDYAAFAIRLQRSIYIG